MALLPLHLYNDVANRCKQDLRGTTIQQEVQLDAQQAVGKVLTRLAQEVRGHVLPARAGAAS